MSIMAMSITATTISEDIKEVATFASAACITSAVEIVIGTLPVAPFSFLGRRRSRGNVWSVSNIGDIGDIGDIANIGDIGDIDAARRSTPVDVGRCRPGAQRHPRSSFAHRTGGEDEPLSSISIKTNSQETRRRSRSGSDL
jgi:hypothetical protein